MARRSKITESETTPTYRVIRIPEEIREAIKRHRAETKNQLVIAETIDSYLPSLINSLKLLGFPILVEKAKGYRLPFDDRTLHQLRDASDQVGVPAAHLLTLSLAKLCTTRISRKRKKAAR